MTTAPECRAKAKEKITQATQDKRHRRKLLSAAEAWLFLAERLDESDHVTVASEVGDDFDTDHHRAVETKPSVAAVSPVASTTPSPRNVLATLPTNTRLQQINRQQTSASRSP
jgi:hypothetical protein